MGQAITYTFRVTGMYCASCTMLIDETLEDMPGIHRSQTTLRTGRTIVQADPSVNPEAMITGFNEAGYEATWEQQ